MTSTALFIKCWKFFMLLIFGIVIFIGTDMEFCHLSYSVKYQVIHQMAFWKKVLCYCVLFCWLNFYMSYQIASWGKIILIFRSSPPKVFLGKSVLEICSKFTGEHVCRSVILANLSLFLSLSIYLLQSEKDC